MSAGTRPLKVGLIGTGFGTRVHMPAIALCPDIEVTALCSANPERAEAAAVAWEVPFHTSDYRALIERDDVDLVDVCTPPASHREMSIAALDAGKHVLCEKPLALNSAESAEMLARAEASGLVHAVNHETRYIPVRRTMRDLVADGYVGRPSFVNAAVHVDHGTNPSAEPYYWGWLSEKSQGGGALMGLLSHHIDLLRFTLGEISGVSGRVETIIKERPVLGFEYRDGDPIGPDTETFGTKTVDAEDSAVFTARIGADALLSVSGSWSLHQPSGVRLEIYGDEGTLQLLPDGTLVGARADDAVVAPITSAHELPQAPEGSHYLVPALARLIEDVAAAIWGGGDHLFATFEDGHLLQQAIEIVQGSDPDRGDISAGAPR